VTITPLDEDDTMTQTRGRMTAVLASLALALPAVAAAHPP
jgi:hypothetical protein